MVYWAILLISSFLNAAQFILEWILLILAHTLNGVKLWCLFLAKRFGIPLLDWLFVGVNNVNLRLRELIKAFKACLNSFIKPLVLFSNFALLTAAVYHIIITYDSPWIGPIIQELSFLSEEIVDALQRERFIYCVRDELSYFSLICDQGSMTSSIPITESFYFTPYEDVVVIARLLVILWEYLGR
jgi:hypothetical protein